MAPAQVLLYYGGPNLVVRHVDESMKIYGANTEVCRRKLLLKHFDDIVMSGSTFYVVAVMYVNLNANVMSVLVRNYNYTFMIAMNIFANQIDK